VLLCVLVLKCVYILFSMRTHGLQLLSIYDSVFENYYFAR